MLNICNEILEKILLYAKYDPYTIENFIMINPIFLDLIRQKISNLTYMEIISEGVAGYIFPKSLLEGNLPPLNLLYFAFGDEDNSKDNVNILEAYHKIYKNDIRKYRIFLMKIHDHLKVELIVQYGCIKCFKYYIERLNYKLTNEDIKFIMTTPSRSQLLHGGDKIKNYLIKELKYKIPKEILFYLIFKNVEYLPYINESEIDTEILFAILLYSNNIPFLCVSTYGEIINKIKAVKMTNMEKTLLLMNVSERRKYHIEIFFGSNFFTNVLEYSSKANLYKYLYKKFNIELEDYFNLYTVVLDYIYAKDLNGLKFIFDEYGWQFDDELDFNIENIDDALDNTTSEIYKYVEMKLM